MTPTLAHSEHAAKPKRKRQQPEKRTQRRIVHDLWMLGFHVSSFSQPFKAAMTAGVPDLFIAHRKWGHAFVEVKAGKNDLTPAQKQWHANAKAEGVTVITARSTTDVLVALGVPIT